MAPPPPPQTKSAEFTALDAHLAALALDPSLLTSPAIFSRAALALTDAACLALLPEYLPRLTAILETTTAPDPSPVTSFLERLLRPVSFNTLLQLGSPQTLAATLSAAAPPDANLLGIALVRKAAATADATKDLATRKDLGEVMILENLLELWMNAPGVDVGGGAGKVVLALLERDSATVARVKWGEPAEGAARHSIPPVVAYQEDTPGTGALWERMFAHDATTGRPLIVGPFIALLSNAPTSEVVHQTSLAQDRLLRIIPHLATLSLPTATAPFPNIANLPFATSTSTSATTNLLELCTSTTEVDDILLARCVVDCVSNLVCLLRKSPWAEHDEGMGVVRAVVRDACARFEGLAEELEKLPARMALEDAEEADAIKAWVKTFEQQSSRLVVRGQDL